MRKQLQKHKSSLYAGAFLAMTAAPIGLYFAAQAGSSIWVWVLLALVIGANLLVLWIP